jgi:general secretion pathway protein I
LNGQRGFTLLEMLAALAVLAICSSVLVAAFGHSARALQQVQRSDRLSLIARSLMDDASDRPLQTGRSHGEWSGVQWQLVVSLLPGAEGPASAYRLDLQVDDGAGQARYSTLQVRSSGTGAAQ